MCKIPECVTGHTPATGIGKIDQGSHGLCQSVCTVVDINPEPAKTRSGQGCTESTIEKLPSQVKVILVYQEYQIESTE